MKKPSPKAKHPPRPKWRQKEDVESLLGIPQDKTPEAAIWETYRHILRDKMRATSSGKYSEVFFAVRRRPPLGAGIALDPNVSWVELEFEHAMAIQVRLETLGHFGDEGHLIDLREFHTRLRQEGLTPPPPLFFPLPGQTGPCLEDVAFTVNWRAGIKKLHEQFGKWLHQHAPKGTPGAHGLEDVRHGTGKRKTADLKATLEWLACVRLQENGLSRSAIVQWLKSRGHYVSAPKVGAARSNLKKRLRDWFGCDIQFAGFP